MKGTSFCWGNPVGRSAWEVVKWEARTVPNDPCHVHPRLPGVEFSGKRNMTTVTIEEAQAHLSELIGHLATGEVLVITHNQKPVARLFAEAKPDRKPRKAGSAKGILNILVEDDEHLRDFAEYME